MLKVWSIINVRKQGGFTLTDLLIYIAMLGILLSAVTAFFITSVEARVKNQSITEVNEQGVLVIDQLTHIIRNATNITTPATGSSSSGFTAVVPTGSLSPTVLSVSSGTLQLQEGASAAVALTNSKVQVTGLTVTNLTRPSTSPILQISLTLARVSPAAAAFKNSYDYSQTFTTSVGVRP